MWLFTRYGFFSVVWKRDRIQIRARCRRHLESLKKRFPFLLGGILELPDADYRYRVETDRESWIATAGDLAAEIDYGNFKEEVGHRFGAGDDYVGLLHEVWDLGYEYQQRF